MNNADEPTPSADAAEVQRPADAEALAELRRLLVGPEQDQLAALRARMDDPASRIQDVGSVLPEAISVRTAKDEKLSKSLAPTIEESIRVSVQRNPRALVDAIFPVMGPAIRKGIADALQRMVRSLGQMLEQGFSIKGLKWRMESFRTGKPYAEIVLLHTLAYRVEQVFLIHRQTGILLQHVAAESVALQDGDMVSGMLTAIQDFVRDSFGVEAQETVGNLEVGSLSVWIEAGPHVILAAVIRGTAPGELRPVMQETVETISLEMAGQLVDFKGETAPFEGVRRHLETCLIEARRVTSSRRISPLAWGAIGIVVLALVLWAALEVRNSMRWGRYVNRLQTEPGIVIISEQRDGSGGAVRGLRDPLSADPEVIAKEMRLRPEKVRAQWEPYYAVHPQFVLRRAQDLLSPPAGATLATENGVLHISGSAPHLWLVEARKNALFVPGIKSVQTEGLKEIDVDRPALERARTLLAPPETVVLSLEHGVLQASGSATYEWLLEARRMVRLAPGITEFREDKLTLTDVPRAPLERARQVLAPPESVVLELSDGVLSAVGTATPEWAAQSRRLVALLPDVSEFRTDGLKLIDPSDALLNRVKAALRPPLSVELRLEKDVLYATGSASEEWLKEAQLLARVLPDIRDFRTNQLVVANLPPPPPPAPAIKPADLTTIQSILAPPDTVALTFADGILTASGKCSSGWRQMARRLTPLIPGVAEYNDAGLEETDTPEAVLAAARIALNPPENVTFELRNGVLLAFGEAPYDWILEARKRSATVPGVRAYVDSALVEWHLARSRIEEMLVFFPSSKNALEPEEREKLSAAVNDFQLLVGAAGSAAARVRVRVIGHTERSLFGSNKESHLALGRERAGTVKAFLVSKGLPASMFVSESKGFSEPLHIGGEEVKSAPSRRVGFEVQIENIQKAGDPR